MPKNTQPVPFAAIESRIHFTRGSKVMLDADLAQLYGVATKNLNLAVTRNRDRFPDDFMFRLNAQEFASLRLQIETSKSRGGKAASDIQKIPFDAAHLRHKSAHGPEWQAQAIEGLKAKFTELLFPALMNDDKGPFEELIVGTGTGVEAAEGGSAPAGTNSSH